MKPKQQTETIRVGKKTAKALRKVAYAEPFNCSSIAEFLRLIERGDYEAYEAWKEQIQALGG